MAPETTTERRSTESARAAPEKRGLPEAAPGEPRHGEHGGGLDAAEDCVHCGFCLPVCPTWQSWQEEMDSPRGRIDLFRAVSDGRLELSPVVAGHFDRCLGCMACVTACPSGVRYDHVIEDARERVERTIRRSPRERLFRSLVFAMFPYPRRLRVAALALWAWRRSGLAWLARRLGFQRAFPAIARLEALAPPLTLREALAPVPARTPAVGERRLRAALLAGCVQRVFFPNVNGATVRVLAAEGVEVVAPRGLGCCGALSVHAGRADEARRLARDLIERLEREDYDVLVVNAAGCGSHLKDLGHLFADDPELAPRARAIAAKVRDATELLAALSPRAPRAPIAARAAYHSPCHIGHAQRLVDQPRRLLATIPGLELVEIPDGDQCCGSAGVYNLVEPESAAEIGSRKAANLLSTGARLVVSANPGCTLQLRRHLAERGATIEAAHPLELLDRAIAAARRGGTP
ncbi:(Fe-S)-binding protein [Anaeromyxobacter oryzae]|uniref:Glycolate oxidase iron-sulfur subunit n=1 Tax=Anaeromyxobacter oryzae TaxID=2918170 RepID=A0ABN6MYR1_9BACT|nr:(Fe-S)-binding protein [Anaeromyxobacter oryzae]BDG05761.1 glycolate oxidase iron-sulfur subunit [Anaeromyxobacter oryzae]